MRTSGRTARSEGVSTTRYRRFDCIQAQRRTMCEQPEANPSGSRKVIDSQGLNALADNVADTVSSNVILSGGADASALNLIEEDQVGRGSTWAAP